MSNYEEMVEEIRIGADSEDDGRIRQGEAACVIACKWGTLKQASVDAHVEYKTLAGRRRVVEFYGSNSAQAEIAIGNSVARWLLKEYPTLRFTHLRVAMGLKDFEDAMGALIEAADMTMTPLQFKCYVVKLRRANGHRPTRIVIDGRAGYRLTIAKD